MSETIWIRRSAGEIYSQSISGGGYDWYEAGAEVVIGSFYATTDWFRVPEGFPGNLAVRPGSRLRATRKFYSTNPLDPESTKPVPHVWAEAEGIGVAEASGQFVLYEIPLHDWPYPRRQQAVRDSYGEWASVPDDWERPTT